jgi:hypothetical protein
LGWSGISARDREIIGSHVPEMIRLTRMVWRSTERPGDEELHQAGYLSSLIVDQFEAGPSGRDDGVAVRGSEAFIGGLFGGLAAYDVKTGALLGQVTKEDGTPLLPWQDVGPMCFNGNNLLILSALGIVEYEVGPRMR